MGMWVRSEDKEPRWSQWVRASTQPDSDPYISNNSSSSTGIGAEEEEEEVDSFAILIEWSLLRSLLFNASDNLVNHVSVAI